MSKNEKHNNAKNLNGLNENNRLITEDLKRELKNNIRLIANDIVKDVSSTDSKTNQETDKNLTKKNQKHLLSEKIFAPRDSMLNELFEISHVRTVYHIFIAILILLFLNSMLSDLIGNGTINIGLNLFVVAFGKFHIVMIIWSLMQLAAFTPYVLIKTWSWIRYRIPESSKKTFDTTILTIFIVYQICFLVIPLKAVLDYELPIVSSFVVNLEMIRFLMKAHAFVRSVSPRILEDDSNSYNSLPKFSWYIYFMFAPTAVYRDSYPRTDKIRWKRVMTLFIEFIATIFNTSYLVEKSVILNWENFGAERMEAKQIVLSIFNCMLPTQFIIVGCFYMLVHCWHNLWAELLTFADKQFYLDWWNQTNYSGYYRTWNMIVQDWLYTYVYKDITMLSRNRVLGALSVFIASSLFHEIAIIFALRFFYPVMLIMFGIIGVFFNYVTKYFSHSMGNVFLWLTLTIGNGLMWSLYAMEYFYRSNCQITNNEWSDIFIPKSLTQNQMCSV